MNESQFKISSEMSVVPKTKKNHKILVVGVLPSILVVGVLPSYCRITHAIRIRQVLIHRDRELVLFFLGGSLYLARRNLGQMPWFPKISIIINWGSDWDEKGSGHMMTGPLKQAQ